MTFVGVCVNVAALFVLTQTLSYIGDIQIRHEQQEKRYSFYSKSVDDEEESNPRVSTVDTELLDLSVLQMEEAAVLRLSMPVVQQTQL
jgi:hypothetical protein